MTCFFHFCQKPCYGWLFDGPHCHRDVQFPGRNALICVRAQHELTLSRSSISNYRSSVLLIMPYVQSRIFESAISHPPPCAWDQSSLASKSAHATNQSCFFLRRPPTRLAHHHWPPSQRATSAAVPTHGPPRPNSRARAARPVPFRSHNWPPSQRTARPIPSVPPRGRVRPPPLGLPSHGWADRKQREREV